MKNELVIGDIVKVLIFDEDKNDLVFVEGSVGNIEDNTFVLESIDGYYEGVSLDSNIEFMGKNIFDELA